MHREEFRHQSVSFSKASDLDNLMFEFDTWLYITFGISSYDYLNLTPIEKMKYSNLYLNSIENL